MKLNRRVFWVLGLVAGLALVRCDKPRTSGTATPPTYPTALPLTTATARVGSATLQLEIADDDPERERGLMYRPSLPEEQGMLFVFQDSDYRKFWMKNTLIPLSIAYIHADGRIANIVDMAPGEEHGNYWSTAKVPFALEVNQGWFTRRGVRPGDQVAVPGIVPAK